MAEAADGRIRLTREFATSTGPALYRLQPDKSFRCVPMPVYQDNVQTLSPPSTDGLAQRRFSTTEFAHAPQPDGSFFLSPLQERRCIAWIAPSGGSPGSSEKRTDECTEQCSAWTCLLPFCLPHTRELLRLNVCASTIPAAGSGLFAYNLAAQQQNQPVFRKGDLVHYYEGEMMSWPRYGQRYARDLDPTDALWFTPYALSHKSRILDAIVVRGILGSSNDISGRPSQEPWDGPATLDVQTENYVDATKEDAVNLDKGAQTPSTCALVATKDIFHGDEIFITYGALWWRAFPRPNAPSGEQPPRAVWDAFESEIWVDTSSQSDAGEHTDHETKDTRRKAAPNKPLPRIPAKARALEVAQRKSPRKR
ncbi:hypothetical protein CAOG_02522 [Capsaspora owczarzaki ATCC 30864]|nr:hypothetical protein CAOG_02522 [Capsaspora owczarzaki ATCC 30864]|eukprot:XP_004349272.2 hypothetical protein CAOG_02522 [Capsaspora owczarzaki ATCC 30864]